MRRLPARVVLAVVLGIALLVAGVVSHYASNSPDGLNSVAVDLGFSSSEQAAAGGPLAGYEVPGLGHPRWSGGLAGVLGCLVVLAVSTLLFRLRRPVSRAGAEDE